MVQYIEHTLLHNKHLILGQQMIHYIEHTLLRSHYLSLKQQILHYIEYTPVDGLVKAGKPWIGILFFPKA